MRTVRPVGVPLKLLTGKKRRLSVDATYKPLLVDTLPTAIQVPPLRYCHAPCVTAVASLTTITTPARVLVPVPLLTVSVASLNALVNSELTVAPELRNVGLLTEVAWSSLMAASVTVVIARVGASLTAVTVSDRVPVLSEIGVVVPWLDTATVVPLACVTMSLWSQARQLRPPVAPFQLAAGWK